MLFESFDTAMMKFRQVLVYSMKWIIIAMLASAILAFAFLFLSVVVHVTLVQGRVERSRDACDAIVVLPTIDVQCCRKRSLNL